MATKKFHNKPKAHYECNGNTPTTAQLPLGYMAFGIVNSKASIWANYDNIARHYTRSPKVTRHAWQQWITLLHSGLLPIILP